MFTIGFLQKRKEQGGIFKRGQEKVPTFFSIRDNEKFLQIEENIFITSCLLFILEILKYKVFIRLEILNVVHGECVR